MTRELLELAAKAAGIEGEHWTIPDGTWVFYEPRRANWNPLTDDGDALRLAVKLRFSVSVEPNYNFVVTEDAQEIVERGEDAYAATRRAIVRAAAEIGRTIQ